MASRSQGVANDHGIACQKMMADPTRQKASVATHRLDGTNIAILANGSRGDVQPFVALASHMEGMGCNVLILTNLNHVNFVQQSGLQAVAASEDSAKGLEGFAHRMATGEKTKREKTEGLDKEAIKSLIAFMPDLILATIFELARGYMLSRLLKIPVMKASLQPWKDSSKVVIEKKWLFVYHFLKKDTLPAYRHILGSQNAEVANFWPSFWAFRRDMDEPLAPSLIHCSHTLNPIPEEKTAFRKATGFLSISREQQEQLAQQKDSRFGGESNRQLEEFLSKGQAPVYMGWGSMVGEMAGSAEHMMCLAARSLRTVRCRGIVLRGWAKLDASLLQGQHDEEELQEYIRENVLFVESAPHAVLFPRCAATVHHGGSGTVAEALRAGVPTIITPCGFDQSDNAEIVARNGCGIALEKLSEVTVDQLSQAIEHALSDGAMKETCRLVSQQLESEDGLGNTVREIQDFLEREVDTGRWMTRFNERCQLEAHESDAHNPGLVGSVWHLLLVKVGIR